jgi:hypothetical protein
MNRDINPLNTELNPICSLLAFLEAHHILHVSRVRVKEWANINPLPIKQTFYSIVTNYGIITLLKKLLEYRKCC